MKTVTKKFGLILLLGIFGTLASNAQTEPVQEKKHFCTKKCTSKKHVYAHGEKGHVCKDACKMADISIPKKLKIA